MPRGRPTDGWTLAVDFGTSFTVGALSRNGPPEVVRVDGEPRIPSIVFMGDDGELVVGWPAENQAALAPARVARALKREVGRGFPMLLGDQQVQVEDAVARILEVVFQEARRLQGGADPVEVRLTHPARWAEQRRTSLERAARLAGLESPALVPEPIGAASYFASERLEPGQFVAVYDLGGGTFDTAVLRRTEAGFEIHGQPGGIDPLGGEDFDYRIYQFLGEQLAAEDQAAWEALRESPERKWRRASADFLTEARKAKEALSRQTSYDLYLRDPVDREIRLTKGQVESLIQADIERTLDELERTIGGAGLSTGDVSAIYLVGGSSKIPLVTRLVQERFGRVDTWADPKAVVALGALQFRKADASSNGTRRQAPQRPVAKRTRDRDGTLEAQAKEEAPKGNGKSKRARGAAAEAKPSRAKSPKAISLRGIAERDRFLEKMKASPKPWTARRGVLKVLGPPPGGEYSATLFYDPRWPQGVKSDPRGPQGAKTSLPPCSVRLLVYPAVLVVVQSLRGEFRGFFPGLGGYLAYAAADIVSLTMEASGKPEIELRVRGKQRQSDLRFKAREARQIEAAIKRFVV